MTDEAADPARGVRRLVAAGLVAALAAAATAFALLSQGTSGSPARPSLFPAQFSQAGFLTGFADLVRAYNADAVTPRLTGTVPGGTTAYLVARCDHGSVVVVVGAASATARCTGSPVGVIALHLARAGQLSATIAGKQARRWGVAVYH